MFSLEKLTSKSWDTDGYFNGESDWVRLDDSPIVNISSSSGQGRFSSHCDIITQETRFVSQISK